jgi:hypothetical protein
MSSEAEALDPTYVSEVLSKPPFVTIEGVHNVRDIGSLSVASDSTLVTRPRFAYRAAELSGIQESGELSCAKIYSYDLRGLLR